MLNTDSRLDTVQDMHQGPPLSLTLRTNEIKISE